MKASIAPHTASGNSVSFDIGEHPYYAGVRRVSQQMTLSQTTVVYDFGYFAGDTPWTLSNIEVTKTQADILKAMQQASTTEYIFTNGISIYKVKIKTLTIKPFSKTTYKISMELTVIEEL